MEKTRKIKDLLWLLVSFGAVAGFMRLGFGLGATTNLSDAVPWGLWKILNMVAGVALSTGGFTLGFLVYVLRLKRFRPLMKAAILVAFLGYGSSLFALLFDIGLPYRFWHPIIMWNDTSFLFEVFWCVLLYFNVCLIEALPPVLQRFGLKRVEKFLHAIAFGVVVVGISLSSLHHSSLGSLFLVTPQRLYSLWYTPLLPELFILSAMGAGMMTVVLAKMVYAWFYAPETVFGLPAPTCEINTGKSKVVRASTQRTYGQDLPMLTQLASIASWILGAYLVLKVIDLTYFGKWSVLFRGTWESWLFVIQLLVSAVIPVVLMALPSTRRTPAGVWWASLSALAGLMINRLDVGIFGYFRSAGTVYFPSLTEWALGIGVVAAAALVFLFTVENFAIFDDGWRERRSLRSRFSGSFDSLAHVWNVALHSDVHRITLLVGVAIPLAWIVLYPPFRADYGINRASPVKPPIGVDVERATLKLEGNRGGMFATFTHLQHQKDMGGKASCVKCHHMSLPGDKSTPCFRCHSDMIRARSIFNHEAHFGYVAKKEGLQGLHPVNESCVFCHGRYKPYTTSNAKTCIDCHRKDMRITDTVKVKPRFPLAPPFMEAMHKSCIPCHRKEAKKGKKKNLGECFTCHPGLKPRALQRPADIAPLNSGDKKTPSTILPVSSKR